MLQMKRLSESVNPVPQHLSDVGMGIFVTHQNPQFNRPTHFNRNLPGVPRWKSMQGLNFSFKLFFFSIFTQQLLSLFVSTNESKTINTLEERLKKLSPLYNSLHIALIYDRLSICPLCVWPFETDTLLPIDLVQSGSFQP